MNGSENGLVAETAASDPKTACPTRHKSKTGKWNDQPLKERSEAGSKRRNGWHDLAIGPTLSYVHIQPLADRCIAEPEDHKHSEIAHSGRRLPLVNAAQFPLELSHGCRNHVFSISERK